VSSQVLRSSAGFRPSAQATNPSFVAFLNNLHSRVTGVCEKFAMLINAQERQACARGVFSANFAAMVFAPL